MFNLGLTEADLAREQQRLEHDWGAMAERTREGALLCTPDRAVDRIMEYVDAGADEVNVAIRAPWNEEALDAYLTDVMPRVRAAVG
jgi:alkanesulfonate monooxygenase SsuD/methylene tetrahydromethanopterin reductase-like flavin-dependent oxidoreductase (luciferase family)